MGGTAGVRGVGAVSECDLPAAAALPDGRVGLFIGGAYRMVPPDMAREFAQRVIAAADEIEQRTGAAR